MRMHRREWLLNIVHMDFGIEYSHVCTENPPDILQTHNGVGYFSRCGLQMIVMLPKKGKLLKTLIMANYEEVRGQGRELGRSGKESKGRPWPIRWPTARTALAEAVHAYGQPRCRLIGRCGLGIHIRRPRTTAQPYAAVRIGHKKGTGHHSPTHLNGRAGRFGIFCLIACAPLSVVVEFRTTSFFFCFFHFIVSCILEVCEGVTGVSLQRRKPPRWIGTQQTIQTTLLKTDGRMRKRCPGLAPCANSMWR